MRAILAEKHDKCLLRPKTAKSLFLLRGTGESEVQDEHTLSESL